MDHRVRWLLRAHNRPYLFILVPALTCTDPLIWSRIGTQVVGTRLLPYVAMFGSGKFFDGKKDPVYFLERLQELIEAYSVDPEDVLKVLPELLTGKARPFWYRNVKDTCLILNGVMDDFET